jgi:Protein of unknown function (DUF4244)
VPPDAVRETARYEMTGRHRCVRAERDDGMTTAEYAVGTVAACGFGGLLYKVLTSPEVLDMLRDLIKRALSVAF